MRYVWRTGTGANRRVMHIEAFSRTGEPMMEALCRIEFGLTPGFNSSINAPFTFGRRVCRRCLKASDYQPSATEGT